MSHRSLLPSLVVFAACGANPSATLLEPGAVAAEVVNPGGLEGKLLVGYQGWFGARGDGSAFDNWLHWAPGVTPGPGRVTFEMWPETSELVPGERFATDFMLPNGARAEVFSSYVDATVMRHVQWMRDYGIDGPLLQRFTSEFREPALRERKDVVTRNIIEGCEAYGRVWGVMYDISGTPEDRLVQTVVDDWRYLVRDLGVLDSQRYLRDEGKPLVSIWGFGYPDRPGTPEQAQRLLDFFHDEYGASVLLGVPIHWRTGADMKPGFQAVFNRADAISPWNVGVYGSDSDLAAHLSSVVRPDLSYARAHGITYMPVIFPGFSWANLVPGSQFNMIPRRGGAFLWKQAYEYQRAGATSFFGAMFDEVDEGTAMFKVVARRADLPTNGRFLALDEDGQSLPSDWYLRVLGAATRMLRGERPLTSTLPITPPAAPAPPAPTPPAPQPPPAPPPAAGAEVIMVTHGYRAILGREPDAGGLQGYSTALANRSLTLLGFCAALLDSPEFAQNRGHLTAGELAQELYRGILGREADPGGLEVTIEAIVSDHAAERSRDMLASPEFAGSFL